MPRPRTPKGRARETAARLALEYPDAVCELDHANPFQLLAATIQSLQTTYGLPAVRGPAEQLMQRSLSHPAVRFRTVAVRQ